MNKLKYYALIDRKVVAVHDLMQWARWFEAARKTDSTRIGHDVVGDVLISTIFLGLDHGFPPFDGAEPVLFESMVFMQRGEWNSDEWNSDEIMQRYRTIEQAEAGHTALVEAFKRHAADADQQAETLLATIRAELNG